MYLDTYENGVVFVLNRELLASHILTHFPQLGPVSCVRKVGVQFVIRDCVLVEV